jgi:hypothetical protein
MQAFRSQKELRAQIGQHLPLRKFQGAGTYGVTIWTPGYMDHPAIGRPASIELDADAVLLKVNGKGIDRAPDRQDMLPTVIPVPSDVAEAALAAEGYSKSLSPVPSAMYPQVIVWLAAGALRGPKRNLNRKHAMKAIAELTGFSLRYVRQLISDGDGVLWKVQRHVISFAGIEPVRAVLGCRSKRVTVTSIPVTQFQQGRASRRAALLSAAIQPGRLESRHSIARRTGVSATTARRYDRDLGYLKKQRHIADITAIAGPGAVARHQVADKLAYAGAFVAGRSVLKMLPNSYEPKAKTTPKKLHRHPHLAAPQNTPGQHIDIVLHDTEDECRRVVFFSTSKQWRRCKARKAGTKAGADSRHPHMAYIYTDTRGGVGWHTAIAEYGVEVA